MTNVYADTSNIVDGQQIDAADVKAPIDALDTQVAGMADATVIVTAASAFFDAEVTLATALAAGPTYNLTAILLPNNTGTYQAKDSGGVTRQVARITSGNVLVIGDTAGIGSIQAFSGGATQSLTLSVSGGNPTVGFFGSAGAVKGTVTGSRGSNAALASLLTLLATYGLLTDSSS